jgi:hypothetical protein
MPIEGRYYVNGGIRDRPGLAGAEARSRILYHHIAARPSRPQSRDLPPLAAWRNLVTVVIAGLPRVGPYRLAQGQRAYERARQGLHEALAALLPPQRVIVWQRPSGQEGNPLQNRGYVNRLLERAVSNEPATTARDICLPDLLVLRCWGANKAPPRQHDRGLQHLNSTISFSCPALA